MTDKLQCTSNYTSTETSSGDAELELSLRLGRKLRLGDTLAHRRRARDTARHRHQQLVHILGAGPLLVREDIAPDIALATLHELDICLHAFRAVCAREKIGDVRVAMQAAELQ